VKISPVIGVVIGIALLVVGVVTRLWSFDVAGAFVTAVSVFKALKDRRGGGSPS
jgi:hypothetical protein